MDIACGNGKLQIQCICFNDLSMPVEFEKFTFDFYVAVSEVAVHNLKRFE